ncbi:MAG: hypothetical protein A2458_02760 [Candidatus Kerfeldbacteria bacterium RIFOXYC2_FULL_38_9]|nr:MAG: hypothetical protein A2458_02760 [Candidatus Kerfeldbacteria bacterium RIFOXYC2_FULL_38_9]
MKTYPLSNVAQFFSSDSQTFQGFGIQMNASLEGVTATSNMLTQTLPNGMRPLISLEFNWLPTVLVREYNAASSDEREGLLVQKLWNNCKLNCRGCYVKQPNLYRGRDLLCPEQIFALIEEAVQHLGTRTLKYLGPTEFLRDTELFTHLDRFAKLGVLLNVFAKDPMLGSDEEVEQFFGEQGIHTVEQFVERLASYSNLRMLYNFRSFDKELTNHLVRGGFAGKEDYTNDYKAVQTRSLKLLHKYFVQVEIERGRPGRLMLINTPITRETVGEAFEIFRYFTDRGIPVCSTTSMRSGCGGKLYRGLDSGFMEQFAQYYAQAHRYSVQRGLISEDYFRKYGPAPYAGINHCMQLCNGLLIRETGQLLRCPGADHADWCESITPQDLLQNGLTWAWQRTRNYRQPAKINVGCLAKPAVFTAEFNARVMQLYEELL